MAIDYERVTLGRLTPETTGISGRQSVGEDTANVLSSPLVAARACAVSFVDARGIRHTAAVQADSLFEAVVLAIRVFRDDPWMERVGPTTVLDVEINEPVTKHSVSLMQVERWIGGASSSPNEAMKKAKLKNLLVQR